MKTSLGMDTDRICDQCTNTINGGYQWQISMVTINGNYYYQWQLSLSMVTTINGNYYYQWQLSMVIY